MPATLFEEVNDLAADNLLLRGIAAYLLAKTVPEKDDRQTALKEIIEVLGPEIDERISEYRNLNPETGQKEIDRLRVRGGVMVALSDSF